MDVGSELELVDSSDIDTCKFAINSAGVDIPVLPDKTDAAAPQPHE